MYEGDTGTLEMTVSGDVRSSDVLEFRIKENLSDSSCLFLQQDTDITDGLFKLRIDGVASQKLKAKAKEDKEYYWGIKLYRNGVEVDTIEAKNKFVVKKGV